MSAPEQFSVGDTVYFPLAPSHWNRKNPYTIVSVDPLTVACGESGPYTYTKDQAAALGMTHQAPEVTQ